MKKFVVGLVLLLGIANPLSSKAFDLKDLFGGNTGSTITNLIEGVFMSSNITISDLVGEWTANGSAVSFKDENLLKKAGGLAATSVIQTKIDPYFEKFGLTGAVITINPDSTFTLKSNKLSLSGTISQKSPGEFVCKFKAFGAISLGEIQTYVQKTSTSMDLMFDASKLKNLLSALSKIVNIGSITTVTDLLKSYDGLYIGFKMTKTGNISNPGSNNTSNGAADLLKSVLGGGSNSSSNNNNSNNSGNNSGSNSSSKATDLLKSVLGGGSSSNGNNSNNSNNNNTNTNSGNNGNSNSSTSSKVTDLLKGILKK